MSRKSEDAAPTPEPRPTSGLAGVLNRLTGGNKASKGQSTQAISPLALHSEDDDAAKHAIYEGPPNFGQLLEQLKPGNSLPDRIEAADALRCAVEKYPLASVLAVFHGGKDLIERRHPAETRLAGWELLTVCTKVSNITDPERLAFFKVISAPAHPEDFDLQLAAFSALGRDGQNVNGFSYEVVPLLTSWLRTCWIATEVARGQALQTNVRKGKELFEERNLALLFDVIKGVIKGSFSTASEEDTEELINVILKVSGFTTETRDLAECMTLIETILTYSKIPTASLAHCVEVLCNCLVDVDSVQPAVWHSIKIISKSHNGNKLVSIALGLVKTPNLDSQDGSTIRATTRQIRGALSVLERLFAKNGKNGYPLVPLSLLMDALTAAVSLGHSEIETDILRLVSSILTGKGNEVMENVLEENWSLMFDVVSTCSRKVLANPRGKFIASRSATVPTNSSPLSADRSVEQEFPRAIAKGLMKLIKRVEELLIDPPPGDFFQKHECIQFFVKVHAHLPEACARMVIDYFNENRCCYPSDHDWQKNILVLLESFYTDRSQPTQIRLHALKAVTDVFDIVEMEEDGFEQIKTFMAAILSNVEDEKDIAVLQEVVACAVIIAANAEDALFDLITDSFRLSITSDRFQAQLGSPTWSPSSSNRHFPSSSTSLVQTPSNVVTRGLVQIFMDAMDKSAPKAQRAFGELLRISRDPDCESDARISALKMLFRLRADWANKIFLTMFTESDGLAASLYRTSASLAKKTAEDEVSHLNQLRRNEDSRERLSKVNASSSAPPRAPMRMASGPPRALQHKNPLWMTPDPEALPQAAFSGPRSLLMSFAEDTVSSAAVEESERETTLEVESDPEVAVLNIGAYLDVILGILEKERSCDWEIYSYVLVHLPSQLSNQALFKNALPQIKALRYLVCDQIKSNSFHDPPLSSAVRKADVAICLFQTLTMIISYHEEFSKSEEDEIVTSFLHGIGSWERAAKCCIHALAVCCHEIPASTSKSLTAILQKMSQIITQQHVAIHILEFLVCLARLPGLYVNFREEEYRTVFAIAFRYLRYVRDKNEDAAKKEEDAAKREAETAKKETSKPHSRLSPASDGARTMMDTSAESNFQPNSSDDLPQYVYALAYHVITFWFLALKLPDRASQVSWITKMLIATDKNGVEHVDQQAQVTIDFMQRTAFADVDESTADELFTPERYGEIQKKRWIVGRSIVTIEQASRGGWAQITKRQPSGTSCYMIREHVSRPPPHQDTSPPDAPADANVVLPNHLLLQLLGSAPQTSEELRPIPLPDDDQTRRAISTFDRNSTVDGHKVGVIYVGERQTEEVEILANVMGSSDYVVFLNRLGKLTRLSGAKFNTQGLDREYNTDGEYTFCWRDRVTEVVFHVTTQMPTNLDHDPQCINKKKHIGNDFVNIIFNNSGLPFKYDTFPSDFNYVNIIITAESRASFVATRMRTEAEARKIFYKVQVQSKPGFPEISPAAETKIVSLDALPGFIRSLALNASVFSLVWANREGGETVSPWRNRLRDIERLRTKHAPMPTSSILNSGLPPPGSSLHGAEEKKEGKARFSGIGDKVRDGVRRTSLVPFNLSAKANGSGEDMTSGRGDEAGEGKAQESIHDAVDFSRWA